MLNPSPEVVSQLINDAKLGDENAIKCLRLFVSNTVQKSGAKTVCVLAQAILSAVESGEAKEIRRG